jgi:hypothetical protein
MSVHVHVFVRVSQALSSAAVTGQCCDWSIARVYVRVRACACLAGVIIGSGIGGVEFFEDNCNKFTAANGGAAGLKKVPRTRATSSNTEGAAHTHN